MSYQNIDTAWFSQVLNNGNETTIDIIPTTSNANWPIDVFTAFHKTAMDWQFPRDTCEVEFIDGEDDLFAQPISMVVDLCVVIYCLYMWSTARQAGKGTATSTAILMLGMEEAIHAINHGYGSSPYGAYMMHVSNYFMTLSIAWALTEHVGIPKSLTWRITALAVLLADVTMVLTIDVSLYFVIAGITVTAVLFAGYVPLLDDESVHRFTFVLGWGVFGVSVLTNEACNCEAMLEVFPRSFPPHALFELIASTPVFYAMVNFIYHAKAPELVCTLKTE